VLYSLLTTLTTVATLLSGCCPFTSVASGLQPTRLRVNQSQSSDLPAVKFVLVLHPLTTDLSVATCNGRLESRVTDGQRPNDGGGISSGNALLSNGNQVVQDELGDCT
jgi:hypothetical protein